METGKEKMLADELYDPLDPQLCQERQRYRDLCKALNDSREHRVEERNHTLSDLLG
jgi:maltose O-acetyltransferase